jgi:hypothetical protein
MSEMGRLNLRQCGERIASDEDIDREPGKGAPEDRLSPLQSCGLGAPGSPHAS